MWVTHGREDALVHQIGLMGKRGRALALRRLRGRGGRMKAFAELLDRLSYTPSRNAKLRLMAGLFPRHARSRPRLGAERP